NTSVLLVSAPMPCVVPFLLILLTDDCSFLLLRHRRAAPRWPNQSGSAPLFDAIRARPSKNRKRHAVTPRPEDAEQCARPRPEALWAARQAPHHPAGPAQAPAAMRRYPPQARARY